MKITLFIGSLYGGGAERVTCNLANYLVKKGHQVEILTMSETKESYELDNKVKVKTLLTLNERKTKIWNTLIRLPKFWSYLRHNKNDVYIVMLPKTIIMLLVFKWMTKAKVIASERSNPAAYPKVITKLLRKYAPKADGFVFQTEEASEWYRDTLEKNKIKIIPNAINPAFVRPRYAGPKRKVIAGAGRLHEQKNFALLIKAFAIIAPDFTDYNLIIYGIGDKKKELDNLVADYNLQNRVFFPGNIQNIAEEMEKNSIFVLSSNYEGMPNALMEAMALGLPCISTDCPVGGPRFLINNDVNGILVPVGDAKSLANAMKELLENPGKATLLGNNAFEIARQLTADKVYGQWEVFIKAVVAT